MRESSGASNLAKKSQNRSCKLTKEQSKDKLNRINKELLSHVGQNAILFVKDNRTMTPYFVELLQQNNRVIARYKCYDSNGKFRCYLNHSPSSVSLMTGEQRIHYFDEI